MAPGQNGISARILLFTFAHMGDSSFQVLSQRSLDLKSIDGRFRDSTSEQLVGKGTKCTRRWAAGGE